MRLELTDEDDIRKGRFQARYYEGTFSHCVQGQ